MRDGGPWALMDPDTRHLCTLFRNLPNAACIPTPRNGQFPFLRAGFAQTELHIGIHDTAWSNTLFPKVRPHLFLYRHRAEEAAMRCDPGTGAHLLLVDNAHVPSKLFVTSALRWLQCRGLKIQRSSGYFDHVWSRAGKDILTQ